MGPPIPFNSWRECDNQMPRRFFSLTPQPTTVFFHVHFLPQIPSSLKHGTFRLATARLYFLSPIGYGHVNVLIVNRNTRKKSSATLPIPTITLTHQSPPLAVTASESSSKLQPHKSDARSLSIVLRFTAK